MGCKFAPASAVRGLIGVHKIKRVEHSKIECTGCVNSTVTSVPKQNNVPISAAS